MEKSRFWQTPTKKTLLHLCGLRVLHLKLCERNARFLRLHAAAGMFLRSLCEVGYRAPFFGVEEVWKSHSLWTLVATNSTCILVAIYIYIFMIISVFLLTYTYVYFKSCVYINIYIYI